ncbi:MAG: AMP-binding protein [Rhodobacteraceae bacterium]|nr:AMP-binding protein [Paracoccaceae bacterium]
MHRRTRPPAPPPPGVILKQSRIDHETRSGNWPNRVITDYLSDMSASDPDATALIAYRTDTDTVTTLSYGELDRRATCIAGNLSAYGIGRGDVVSFQLPNWWQFVAIHLACVRIGAISNPLMPIFRARELDYMIGFAESKVLIVPRVFQKFDYEALANQLKQTISTLDHVFVIDGAGDNAFESELMCKPPVYPPIASPLSPNDVVQLLYTSGTTGQPKGALHTSNTLIASTRQIAEHLKLGPNDVGFMPAPFAHQIGFCFGMMTPIYIGIPLVIMDIWNPETAIDLIEKYQITYTCASTPFMVDLANVKDVETRKLDKFRYFATAGAPIMEPVVEKVTAKLGVSLIPGWGMTEVSHVTSTKPISALTEPLTDGAAFPGSEVRVVDGAGKVLPPGEVGHLHCRGATLFVGYYKKPELYGLDKDGWFDTGDLAFMDDKGNIRISGRDKDIIIRGGENVPVLEVESLICKMPEVADVAVVAMPDERLGERGCAFVTLSDGASLTFEQMVAFLTAQNLAKQYFPEHLEILEIMPRTPSGKIQKFQLRTWATQLAENGRILWDQPKS